MKSVLVIDDEPDVRDSIKRVLGRAGFVVRTVDSAMAAMVELRRLSADVVLTDIIMPKIDGVEAIKQILLEFPTVRIVAISGGGNFDVAGSSSDSITTGEYLGAAKRAGAHIILTKPFESRELIQAIMDVMGAGNDIRS